MMNTDLPHAASASYTRAKGIRRELPNGSTSKMGKGLIQKVWTFSTHGGYVVYGGCDLFEIYPISLLNTTPKNILALIIKNILILWFEISAQNLAFKKSLLEIIVSSFFYWN